MPESATLPASASRRNSKAAAQNEEKADAAKDSHTDGPADGEEKQLKIDGERLPQPKKRRPSLLNRRSPCGTGNAKVHADLRRVLGRIPEKG